MSNGVAPAFVIPSSSEDSEAATPEQKEACGYCETGYALFKDKGVTEPQDDPAQLQTLLGRKGSELLKFGYIYDDIL